MYTPGPITVCTCTVMCILRDTSSMAIITGQMGRLHTSGYEAQSVGVGPKLVLWPPDEYLQLQLSLTVVLPLHLTQGLCRA